MTTFPDRADFSHPYSASHLPFSSVEAAWRDSGALSQQPRCLSHHLMAGIICLHYVRHTLLKLATVDQRLTCVASAMVRVLLGRSMKLPGEISDVGTKVVSLMQRAVCCSEILTWACDASDSGSD